MFSCIKGIAGIECVHFTLASLYICACGTICSSFSFICVPLFHAFYVQYNLIIVFPFVLLIHDLSCVLDKVLTRKVDMDILSKNSWRFGYKYV